MALALLSFSVLPAAVLARETRAAGTEPAYAAYGYRQSPVAMEASYGYDNMAKGGRYLPVYVTLTNQQKEIFTGNVAIKSMESDFEIYQYEYQVELGPEETVQINLNIPLGLRADQIYVKLYDKEQNLLVQKRLKMNMRRDTPELLIGTLSDAQDQLEYFDDVGILYSTLQTRRCAMVAGSIPWQAAGLDQLDVLVITNYDIRRLNDGQIDTIKEWVSRGGVLILGTGEGGQEAVEAFLERDLEQALEDPGEREVNMGDEFAVYGPDDVRLPLMTTQVKVREGKVVFSSSGLPVLTSVNREKGIIAVAAYDFCDISEFCQEHSYVDKLFTSLLGEERIQELAEYLYDRGNSHYWAAQGMLNSGSAERLPNIPLYVVVIFSYILLVGPGLYFFLKQRDMRRYYGGFVIALACVSSGIIYLMGRQTRFQTTFFSYASVQDYTEDTIISTIYMNMRTPYHTPYGVDLDDTYDIRPLTRSAGYDNAGLLQFTGEEQANITIKYQEGNTHIAVQDVAAFSPHYFQLEKREENEEQAGIVGQIHFFDGRIRGSITNQLGINLEQGALFCANGIVLLPSFAAGETLVLDDKPVLYYPFGKFFAVADRITGGYQFETVDIRSENYMKALKRSNLLSVYLDEFLTGYQYRAKVIAFSSDGEDTGFLKDDSSGREGLTMYTAYVDADFCQGGQVYHTSRERAPKVISGNYNGAANTMDGLSPLTLEYSLGEDLSIDKLSLVSISEEFTDSVKNGSIPVFGGDIYFYNNETRNYDKMDRSQKEFIGWQLEPYLTRENTITIRYAYETPQDYSLDLSLPVITIVGRKLDAEN